MTTFTDILILGGLMGGFLFVSDKLCKIVAEVWKRWKRRTP